MDHASFHTKQNGMSVIEILISVAIVVIIATLSWSPLVQFLNVHSVDTEASMIISTVAYARSQSMSGRNDSAYGIHFASTTVTMFLDTTYNPSATTNVVRQISGGVSISIISLGAGVSDVVFGKLTGSPSAVGTITISSAKDNTRKKIIRISGAGVVE